MERAIRMKLASALAAISYQVVKRNKADLLYELVDAIETLESGEEYILLARESGADSIQRFWACLVAEGVDSPTYEQCIEKAERTLGVSYIFKFQMDLGKTDFHVEIKCLKDDKHEKWMLDNDFSSRGILYKFIG
jgi:hypothetical protein